MIHAGRTAGDLSAGIRTAGNRFPALRLGARYLSADRARPALLGMPPRRRRVRPPSPDHEHVLLRPQAHDSPLSRHPNHWQGSMRIQGRIRTCVRRANPAAFAASWVRPDFGIHAGISLCTAVKENQTPAQAALWVQHTRSARPDHGKKAANSRESASFFAKLDCKPK